MLPEHACHGPDGARTFTERLRLPFAECRASCVNRLIELLLVGRRATRKHLARSGIYDLERGLAVDPLAIYKVGKFHTSLRRIRVRLPRVVDETDCVKRRR